ncbi:unnamed protein product [Arabis nemorensis]|uniref:Uncharacterized protein n=1 Tax=Arabis nemorensis TaxID=586526 RepID=A0A565CB93_9BRAS|nr:unnamed protein product [Arabis nemorensis]
MLLHRSCSIHHQFAPLMLLLRLLSLIYLELFRRSFNPTSRPANVHCWLQNLRRRDYRFSKPPPLILCPSKIHNIVSDFQIWAWPKIFCDVVSPFPNLPRPKSVAKYNNSYSIVNGSAYVFGMSNFLISSSKERDFLSTSSFWERSLPPSYPFGKRTSLPFSLSMRGKFISASKPRGNVPSF